MKNRHYLGIFLLWLLLLTMYRGCEAYRAGEQLKQVQQQYNNNR